MLLQNTLLPLDNERTEKRLLILACSERKKETANLIPAIERYDGPMWNVLRSFLQKQSISTANLDIYVLSAEFGLISASQPIPYYDRILTEDRAGELHTATLSQFRHLMENNYTQVCFGLSKLYFNALRGWEDTMPFNAAVTITDGPMATKLSQLKAWLRNETWKPKVYSSDHRLTAKTIRDEVVLKGVSIRLSRKEILEKAREALAKGAPEASNYRDWYVEIDGQPVAPKWLVSLISAVTVDQFDASRARKVLTDLGIEVLRAH